MKIRKVFAVALIAAICLSLYFVYAPASAEDLALTAQDGLCVHHPEHTAECGYYVEAGEAACAHVHDAACGYVEPMEGQPCAHVHDAACGYVEAREAVPCDQGCTDLDDDSVIDHVAGCAYQPAEAGQPCTHVHDETCGYAEAVEGQPCAHVHDETCGYVDPSQTGVCVYAQAGCPYCVVDWQWSDPQGFLTQEADGSWSMDMPGVSASNSVSASALQSFLPTEIATRMDNDTMPALAIAWDLTAIPADGATSGDYLLQAYLADPTYALTDAAAPLQVTLRLGGAETLIESIPSGNPPYADKIVTGVSPAGTTINLFDYWITDQFAADNTDEDANKDKGINANHALLFTAGKTNRQDAWNQWTGSKAPYSGIVDNELDNGYPKLKLNMTTASNVTSGRDGTESLAYLFDPKLEHQGKQSFSDVKGLLQVDSDGYYYYNSTRNYAVYYSDTNSFMLYKYPGVVSNGASGIVGQFFPFNQATEDATYKYYNPQGANKEHQGNHTLMNWTGSDSAQLNHYFGLHMSTRFIQENGGHVSSAENAAPVTYEFSGDDDVWIFIDDKLVADLGGIHDAASVKIDFSTGEIWINGIRQNDNLGKILGYQSDTLPDNTYHTLDFFMLERGNVDSNMSLKYNLVTIPESSLIKVDQIGDPVPGAVFQLYAADDTDFSDPIATGTTNSTGQFIFRHKTEDRPITIEELYDDYNVGTGNNADLILREITTPSGYRTNGDIELYFVKTENDEILLLSNSIWDKGAYAMSKVTATVKYNEISFADSQKNSITLKPEDSPLLFAVVYQKKMENGEPVLDANRDYIWLPVSGDPLNGWHVAEDSSWSSILAAARENPYVFHLASSGAYQVDVSNLPGNILSYYYVCGDLDDAKYTIAYYYTDASSLQLANASNTWRIASDQGELDRVFSVNLYVSNIKNTLLVQKVDEDNNPVPGAVFTLYEDEQVTIDQGTGKVTISNPNSYYDRVTTENSSENYNVAIGTFPTLGHVLASGEYYLVETSAPQGYKKSENVTHIVVDNTGVYAHAGEADDGIVVLRGVGSLMRSMVQFAADDDVDTTLHHIQATLATEVQYEDEDGSISHNGADWTTSEVLHLQYANGNNLLDYGLHAGGEGTIDSLTLDTDVGWSKLLIQQCYQHDSSVDTSLKTDLSDQNLTNLFSGTVVVRVTNERVGDLEISKKVTGEGAPAGKQFLFEIRINDKYGRPLQGTYSAKIKGSQGTTDFSVDITDGVAKVELKAGESIRIIDLPYQAAFTVTEAVPANFTAHISGNNLNIQEHSASGTIPCFPVDKTDVITAAFTNEFDGSDTITLQGIKNMLGRSLKNGETFTFELTEAENNPYKILSSAQRVTITGSGSEPSASFTFAKMEFSFAGTYTFYIREVPPQGVDAQNPVSDGVQYDLHICTVTVTVTVDDTDKATASVSYSDGDMAVFNNVGSFDLTIAKLVTGEMGDRDKLFDFTIAINAPGGEYPYTGGKLENAPEDVSAPANDYLTVENGTATFQLSHYQTITIHGLPVGTSYTITEPGAQADGYTVTASGSPGKVTMTQASCTGMLDQANTVTFTNEKATAVPTGLRLDALPWLLALLCGLAGCTALCVTGKTRRRKGGCGRTHG